MKKIALGMILALSANAETAATKALRNAFAKAQVVKGTGVLTNNQDTGGTWVCMQHSTVEGSKHTSYFIRKYTEFAGFVSSEMSFFEDFRNFVPATFVESDEGLVGSQYFVTDRFMVEGAEGLVHVRRHGKHLIEEWTLDRPYGRGYSVNVVNGRILPGDMGGFSNSLLPESVSSPERVVFLYASCQLKDAPAANASNANANGAN